MQFSVLSVNTMLSSDFMGYIQAKGAEGAALCSSGWYIGSTIDKMMIVRAVARQAWRNSPEEHLEGCTCWQGWIRPIYVINSIKIAEENTGLTMRRSIDTNSFTEILKPPSKTLSGYTMATETVFAEHVCYAPR